MSASPDARGMMVKVLAFSAGILILLGLYLLTTDFPMIVSVGVLLAGVADLGIAVVMARRT